VSGTPLAVLVGGGPAPGINGVIAAVTTEAARNGLLVLGLYDGFAHIANRDTSQTIELTRESVAGIYTTGGSILRTSRTNPARDDVTLQNCVDTLTSLGVGYLVTIGGDDTSYGASRIAKASSGAIRVAAVPKTIDNDLPLPGNAPTFGFETARSVGSRIIEALVEDAYATGRWYLAVTMGRRSGALALGMCSAAGAHLAVIPEEFSNESLDVNAVADAIVGAIVKRKAAGHRHGVAIVAEGVAERFSERQLAELQNTPRDAYGHVRLADIPIGAVLREAVERRAHEIGIETTIVTKDVGYELRCAKPVPFDVDYTRTLGYGAVRYLVEGGTGALVAIEDARLSPMPFEDLQDPQTGRIRVRMVDTTTESYRAARSAMWHIEPEDLQEPNLSRLALQTNLNPAVFARRFGRGDA
jgi:6-phosphofructokinase